MNKNLINIFVILQGQANLINNTNFIRNAESARIYTYIPILHILYTSKSNKLQSNNFILFLFYFFSKIILFVITFYFTASGLTRCYYFYYYHYRYYNISVRKIVIHFINGTKLWVVKIARKTLSRQNVFGTWSRFILKNMGVPIYLRNCFYYVYPISSPVLCTRNYFLSLDEKDKFRGSCT